MRVTVFRYANSCTGRDRFKMLTANRQFSRKLLSVQGDVTTVVYTEPIVNLVDQYGRGVTPPNLEVKIIKLLEDCPIMKRNTYILYKGDEVIAVGTMASIAQKLGVKKETIKYYSMPAYRRKCRGNNSRTLYKVVEDEE